MNRWILITFLLSITKPTRATDITDIVNRTGTTELAENATPHSSPLAATEQPDTPLAATEQPDTPLAATEQPDTPLAATEQPDTPLAATEQPDTPLAATEHQDTASVAPAPETLLKGNGSAVTESPGSVELLSEPVDAQEPVGDCGQAGSPGEMQLLGNAISKFGLDLFKEVLQETTKPNVVISPLSIALGLAQLSLGSVNETEKQIQKALHFNSLNCSHRTLCSYINNLPRSALSMASAIYVRQGFHIKPEFIKQSMKFYKSQPQLLTGVNAKDTDMINSWVQQMTEQKIKTFLNEVPSTILLLLLNAIHFKGMWQVQFDPHATSDDIFYKEDGSYINVAMMQHPKYPISGFHDDDLQIEVARLSFKQNMSFIVVKPTVTGKLDHIVSKLNISQLLAHFFKARPMLVKVPKLNIDFDVELSQALKSLGLGNLFTNPKLSRISPEPLFVSSVQHKATMELKEEGVEAAASTSIAVSRSFLQYTINRPFFFIIRDDISGIPIFLGTIKDPKPQLQMVPQEKLVVNLERMRKSEEFVAPK
ncbi:serpin peptidase inhibitor, clade F (alpha-2 antiplasmin, pigment epithelium derived factor), member 2b isoform X2 [Scyliorhinus torazame]